MGFAAVGTSIRRDFRRSSDMITVTLAGVMQEYLKSSERTVFWDEEKKANVDPFTEMDSGFFAASWDLKVRLPRLRLPWMAHMSACLQALPNGSMRCSTTPTKM